MFRVYVICLLQVSKLYPYDIRWMSLYVLGLYAINIAIVVAGVYWQLYDNQAAESNVFLVKVISLHFQLAQQECYGWNGVK